MFHLYFGAFDVVMYLGGTYCAIALSKAICDQMDAAEAPQRLAPKATVAPMQSIPPHLAAPATKREEVGVKVSVG
jgi:hypothetical protein